MEVKERWNEDGNIKKNVKIVKNLKIVKMEKMMICARGSGLQGTESLHNRELIRWTTNQGPVRHEGKKVEPVIEMHAAWQGAQTFEGLPNRKKPLKR